MRRIKNFVLGLKMVKTFLTNIIIKQTIRLFTLPYLFFIQLVVRNISKLIGKRVSRKLHFKKLKIYKRNIGKRSLFLQLYYRTKKTSLKILTILIKLFKI
jgi:hypothetical protein